jgi:hypothetical protein
LPSLACKGARRLGISEVVLVAPNHFPHVAYFQVKSAGKHGAVKQSRLGVLGLGTARGTVVVWDVKRGEIATTCGEVSVFAAVYWVSAPIVLTLWAEWEGSFVGSARGGIQSQWWLGGLLFQ